MTDNFTNINKITTVSRETFETLELFAQEVTKWNSHINLISKKNIDEVWQRHIIDSVQLINFINSDNKILTDFGSGGGFPAIVLAILGNFNQVNLIESDKRKCAFLNDFSSKIDKNIKIYDERIEDIEPFKSDIVTARALAPLDKLFNLLLEFINKTEKTLFLKGENIQAEIENAQKNWQFDYILHNSITNNNAKIIEISKLELIN